MNHRRADLPLSDYGIIGDGLTAALVALDGSIDWLCYGRFDGPAVFCRLLDKERGGFLQVAPTTEFNSTQRYVGNTNVLATEFECATGKVRLTDCMPVGIVAKPVILRKVEGLSGDVDIGVTFVPTFDFARANIKIELAPGGCRARASKATLRLECPASMTNVAGGVTGSFPLSAGETRWVIVTHGTPPLDEAVAERALRSTLDNWERWSAKGDYPRPYDDLLRRSALLLKLLIYSPNGAMVAAPTTSLPEVPGGVRNWDYRFTWLRDASWVVSSLMELGYHNESMAFIDWLETLDLGSGTPSVLYDVDGEVPSVEQELQHLRGYRGARPVRIGNAAAMQDQHDVFGEVIAAIHMCSESVPSMRPLRPELWKLVTALADKAAAHWEHADHGVWEVRDHPRQFLSSKRLCWTALDRALSMARRDGLSGPLAHWSAERARLNQVVLSSGFDRNLGAFTRALGEPDLDASALLLPRNGMLPVEDSRVASTVEVVRDRLSADTGLLRRYVAPDGLPGIEGAFTACSFWLVDCLARQGRVDDAHGVFESVVAYASDLGLMSEQINPESGELLGNYPQALTHLALIGAADAIDKAERGQPVEPGKMAQRGG
ncbi:MAG: glycoside hydrolase family 15 protein [Gemmatimonadota bacterium]